MRRAPWILAVVVLSLGVGTVPAAFGDSSSTTSTSSSSPSSTTTTTTTIKITPVAPLTGLPDPTKVTRHRAALTIKIDNTQEARPQYGIDKADVIYEEIVEGGITRLAAVFNSHVVTKVGPVRSVRRTDREIVYPLGGIFAFSGGAAYALSSIETAPVKLFDQFSAGSVMFRDLKRPPPHNLFANAVALMAKGGKPEPPPAIFTYRPPSTSTPGPRVNGFTVGFAAGYATSYLWNGTTRSWDRSIFGRPDVTADGARLSPQNVIVMSVRYQGGVGVEGSAAVLTGTGQVEIFTSGRVERGTWSRQNLRKAIVYKNAVGKVIALTPGQTWVELLDVSERVTITSAP